MVFQSWALQSVIIHLTNSFSFSCEGNHQSYESIWDRVDVMGVLSGQMREASWKKTLRPEEGMKGGWEQGREPPGRGNGMCEALKQDLVCRVVEELKGGRRVRRPDSTSVMRALAQSLGFILGHWGATGRFKARERCAQIGKPHGCNVWFSHTVAS